MLRTFKYISSLVLCLLVVYSAQAQKKINPKTKLVTDTIKVPFFNGITVLGDAASVANSFLSKGDTYSYEAALQADFKHKYFPIFELGYAGADKLTVENVGFKTNGLFGRAGIDFNMLKQKKDSKRTTNLLLLGLRLGMSSFNYNISNVNIADDYWGGSTQALNYNNISTTKIWYELTAGIRVEVLKNMFMGWTIRSKTLISKDVDGAVTPWYIPGFGINKGSNLGISYTIGYKFQLPTKKRQPVKVVQPAIVNKQ
jgi:hypothetical protein